ncbi:hypothetical protein [Streptomyces sp. NPDC059564]|uniref:hypothetical protein n=1 Tax=Streptomyces sp. NPDC059564 TaxID=3346865 RepID=UPI0036BA618B
MSPRYPAAPGPRTGKRELRGQILDEYLADYEQRRGSLTPESQQAARQVFDEVFALDKERSAAS